MTSFIATARSYGELSEMCDHEAREDEKELAGVVSHENWRDTPTIERKQFGLGPSHSPAAAKTSHEDCSEDDYNSAVRGLQLCICWVCISDAGCSRMKRAMIVGGEETT